MLLIEVSWLDRRKEGYGYRGDRSAAVISIRQCLRFSIFVCNQQFVFVAVSVCVLVLSGMVLVLELVPVLVFVVVLVDRCVANTNAASSVLAVSHRRCDKSH